MIVHHAEVICHEVTSYNNSCQNHEGQYLKKVKKAISRFPDRDLKFPEPGNFSSGPDKSGIGKPEHANPTRNVEGKNSRFAQMSFLICDGKFDDLIIAFFWA